MNLLQQSRKLFAALALSFVLLLTACGGGTNVAENPGTYTGQGQSNVAYQQLERGNTAEGQNFGEWVVNTGQGLIKDAYVRDGNKLGAVVSSNVRPNEVRPLARSLVQGFQKNFPNRDLTVLMYAPDKQLILTARYDHENNQVVYE